MAYYIDMKRKEVFKSLTQPSDMTHMHRIDDQVARRLGLRSGQALSDHQIDDLTGAPHAALATDRSPEGDAAGVAPEIQPFEFKVSSAATPSNSMPTSVARARTAASIVEVFNWVVIVIGVIAGIVVASQSSYGINNDTGAIEKTHPYIGLGLGIAVGIAINCLMIIMVAAYIKAKMELAQRAG